MELDLAARIARLEAIEEIKRLKARYFEYCDHDFNPDGITALFTKTGVFDGGGSRIDLHVGDRYVGHDQLRAYFKSIPQRIQFSAHLGINPIIEVQDADHATGRWRMLMPSNYWVEGGKEASWLVAAYDDRYIRSGGLWLFEVVKLHVNFLSPHSGSWAELAIP